MTPRQAKAEWERLFEDWPLTGAELANDLQLSRMGVWRLRAMVHAEPPTRTLLLFAAALRKRRSKSRATVTRMRQLWAAAKGGA